ncbi:Myosin light chain kinase, smooth muscle [Orchesella cincta]|uniref:Myosin light chain kinase, smooth muscle n=1 Tax=Orchesella cincta TaxID=48709 RepID=A0A1D2NEC0_ORCCI|nr:Myosin light chain kinase, smooth muscle [Orchesella cincta]
MKVSDTAIVKKKERGPGTQSNANRDGGCDEVKDGSNKGKGGKSNLRAAPAAKGVTVADSKSKPEVSGPTKGKPVSPTNVKKPWIPCTRRSSKPKPPPAILEMELSFVDPNKICKKYPKSPSSDSSDTDRNKCALNHPLPSSRTSSPSPDRRTKVILKRQFALDKATSNSKESISDESLNSINSVTQLLKIERSAFALNNNKSNQNNEDEEEEEIITGVKLLAARLQARNANLSTSQNGKSRNENNRNCKPSIKDGLASKIRQIHLATQNEPNKINTGNAEIAAVSKPQENLSAKTIDMSTSTIKLVAATATVFPTTERKIVHTKESSSNSVTRAAVVVEEASVLERKNKTCTSAVTVKSKKASSTIPIIKSSTTPTTLPASSSLISKSERRIETSNKKREQVLSSSTSKSSTTTTTNNPPTVASSLAKQTNQIKHQESRVNQNQTHSGVGQHHKVGNRISGSHSPRKNVCVDDHHRDPSPVVLKQARDNRDQEQLKSGGSSSKGRTVVFSHDKKLRGKAPCKSDAQNNKTKKETEESSSSLSSSASSTSSSLPTWRSRQEQRIIPSIIMSEYVEGDEDGKAAVVANSQSLFIPLQFVEPLEPTCDILEGSCLELKVRIRGAEAVVWVKEDKIIPNAPPDFTYFEKKTDGIYGLRIADVFLEDGGLYICEAYGAGGSELSCWCEVDVIEISTNDDEISWEDLDMSDELSVPTPLVVPVIVTSQADQETEPSPPLETARSKEPSPIRTVEVMQVNEPPQLSHKKPSMSSEDQVISHVNSGASDSDFVLNDTSFKSSSNKALLSSIQKECEEESSTLRAHSPSEVVLKRAESPAELATEFASTTPIKETQFTYPDEIQSEAVATTTVAILVPAEIDQVLVAAAVDNDTSTGGSQQEDGLMIMGDDHHGSKRKLASQLSSASDESISLKEPRSGDEGALSSAEEMSASISLDIKSSVTNDDDAVASESPACSPFSEQNGRSSSVDSAIGFLGRPLFCDGKFPPRILMGPSNIIALYGEIVHLRVKVQNYGIPKTAVNWFKFLNGTYKKIELVYGDQVLPQSDAHVAVTKCEGSLSTLTITQINYDDCGRYRVKVQNSLGMDSHDCVLTVEGPPEAPTTPPKVKYDEKGKTILIQWSSCPYDGGSKITGYYVEASIIQGSRTAINKDDQENWQLLTPQSYSWLCYTLTNPKRGSVYRFRVFGENSYGKEEPSIRADSKREIVHEHENEAAHLQESVSASSQEEEPIEYKNVVCKRESIYNVYDKFDELGKGRFGIVFEVVNKETKKSCAGKFVKCIKAKDKERVQLEVKIMNDLEYHPKLICLIDAFEMPREIVIVTQRINGGELFERVVADDFTLTEGDCITFLRQICDAVKYIHDKNIMHLDLKPENILCTSKNSNQIKIIDFGLAQYYDPKEPIRVLFGTAEFVSPEIINYEPIALSTDNWSVGVITYILLSGLSPFMGDNDNETFSNITRAEFDFDDEAFENISEDSKDFISNLIVKRPEKRMTAEECLDHRWLKQESGIQKKAVVLPTDKLKRFLVRRKWQKTGNAIRALGRITTLYSSRRSSSTSSTSPTPTGSFSMSISSSPLATPSRNESLVTQESADYDNVFISQTSTTTENCSATLNNNDIKQPRHFQLATTKNTPLINNSKPKYADPCRSDSGVCDVGSFSSSLNSDV